VTNPALAVRASASVDEVPILSSEWQRALDALEADLSRRAGRAQHRHAYRLDSLQLARWATAAGIEPGQMQVRSLRRYLATLSEHGQAATTVARKLAGIRALFRVLVALGRRGDNPADLLSAPKTSPAPPARAQAARGGGAARPDSGHHRWSSAIEPCSSSPMPPGSGPRNWSRWTSARSTSTPRRARGGKGG